jgi:hypothetical protein
MKMIPPEWSSPAWRRRGIAESDDDIDLARHQFINEARQPVDLHLCATVLERQIFIERIAVLSEAADERRSERAIVGNRRRNDKRPDAIDLGRPLCGDSTRPHYRRAEKCDELPPPHGLPQAEDFTP